jgi:hypothetical protein
MFTQRYLHGRNENIKTIVDIGKAVDDTPEQAEHMMNRLLSRETLYFRCLVEAYREWHKKSKVADRVAEREIERSVPTGGMSCWQVQTPNRIKTLYQHPLPDRSEQRL